MDIKSIKKKAKDNLKKHFFSCLIVTFITITVLGGGYYSTNNNLEFSNNGIQKIETLNKTRKEIGKVELAQSNAGISNSDIINRLLARIFEKDLNNGNNTREFKYNKGIAAMIVNQVTSQQVSVGILNTIFILIYGNDFLNFIISFLFTMLSIIMFFLIKKVIVVGKDRFFLEERRYIETKIDKILFPYRIKKTLHIAKILFFQYCYQFLWNLTIVGGIIKKYEYIFIPYVLAENPKISKKEAFRISKELTDGIKFELFKLDLSLILYYIIGILTMNITNILFFNGYYECIIAECYIQIRRERLETLTDKAMLNDILLDISKDIKGEYPMEKYPTKVETRKWLTVDYDRNYSIQHLILLFFTFSFIGYIYEVFLSLVTDGILVNRGMLHGPWLPIYGVGGVLMLVLLKRFRNKPVLVFIMSVLLAGIVEYTTGWYLETYKNIKYWDYTGFFLNINGWICFDTLLVFGLGGCAFNYILGPVFDNIYNNINSNLKNNICKILLIVFLIDLSVSLVYPNKGHGISDYEVAKITVQN